jgi:dihydroneopterin aldolase
MNKILIEDIELYAYHGCLIEEEKIGANYIVNVELETDFSEASLNDDLTKTINYVVIYDIVKAQMKIRSNLIENVGKRIVDCLMAECKTIKYVVVKITKLNPPMNGNVKKASIIISS